MSDFFALLLMPPECPLVFFHDGRVACLVHGTACVAVSGSEIKSELLTATGVEPGGTGSGNG